jgi:hypothetical protein
VGGLPRISLSSGVEIMGFVSRPKAGFWVGVVCFLLIASLFGDAQAGRRQEASERHKRQCKEWCAQNEECGKCMPLLPCPPGTKKLKSWTGFGKNWYACSKPGHRRRAGQEHRQDCEKWCKANPDCGKCLPVLPCPPGTEKLKGWTGYGKNWYACSKPGKSVRSAGDLFAINVPGKAAGALLSPSEAWEVAAKYHWVYVNASLKTVKEAKEEATKLSNALNRRPAVLVYMPRHMGDDQRDTYHPDFQQSLSGLLKYGRANNGKLLVTARSYGVHQALRVIAQLESPDIMLIGIAPAFGVFGNQASANVARYVQDLSRTKSRVCLIASKDDGFTFQAGGAAYRRASGRIRGDDDVYRALKANRANTELILLDGADHAPVDEYLRHGLARAMRQAVAHFGWQDTPVFEVVSGRPAAR